MISDDEYFLTEFEACRWPLERWHHLDHIKLAYIHLQRFPFDMAMEKLRAGIKAHNAAHGIVDAPTSGYHETMRQAWLRLVYVTICEYGPSESGDAFCESHPKLTQKKTLRLFYSRQLFMSPGAKMTFLEPDLAPLPMSRRSK